MKILVFGSANIDHTYNLPHLTRSGETLSSEQYTRSEGGKGFNQALALSKAGQETYFAGAVGKDGLFLAERLQEEGVDTTGLRVLDVPTGHAIIQVDAEGHNAIVLYGGANQQITDEMITQTLERFAPGDYVLLQNELNDVGRIICQAREKGLRVVLNPSPCTENVRSWPLDLVDWFILNEIEGKDLTERETPEEILKELLRLYPNSHIVLTLGEAGAVYADADTTVFQAAIPTHVVDTTGAGDTFTGYFLQSMLAGEKVETALKTAAYASSIAVSRMGAGRSIPRAAEVRRTIAAATQGPCDGTQVNLYVAATNNSQA